MTDSPALAAPPRRRARRVLLVLLLVASLAANAVAAALLLQSFSRLHLLRNFPLGFVPEPGAPLGAPGAGTLVFWGDSRSALWPKQALAERWQVIDEAHGGTTSTQLLMLLREAPMRHDDVGVVQTGINDLHPMGALPSLRDTLAARLPGQLAAVRDALLARSERVVIATIAPPAPVPLWRRPVWDAGTEAEIARVNALIRRMDDGARVRVLDVDALLRGPDGRLAPEYRDPDFFLHFSPAAYARLDQALQQLLAHPARSN